MSKDIHGILLEVIQNEEVNEKLLSCKSPEECFEAMSEYVEGISFDEFIHNMKKIYMYYEENEEGLLGNEELDAIAGGLTGQEVGAIISSGTTVVAASSLAAC